MRFATSLLWEPGVPIYEYACKVCEHEFETIQRVSDAPLEDCPECGVAALRKKVSVAAFRLKGGGWYETDFKAGAKKNLHGEQGAADSAKDGDKDKGKDKGKGEAKDKGTDGGKASGDTAKESKAANGKSAAKEPSKPAKSAAAAD